MPRLVLFLPVALLVAACGQEATPTAPVPPATAPPDAIAAPSPIAEPTETVRTYFMRIQAKDYAGAWSMWGDGGAASGTYVLKMVDADTIEMELIGHEIDGEPQPAKPAVKVVRKAESASEAPKVDVPAPATGGAK